MYTLDINHHIQWNPSLAAILGEQHFGLVARLFCIHKLFCNITLYKANYYNNTLERSKTSRISKRQLEHSFKWSSSIYPDFALYCLVSLLVLSPKIVLKYNSIYLREALSRFEDSTELATTAPSSVHLSLPQFIWAYLSSSEPTSVQLHEPTSVHLSLPQFNWAYLSSTEPTSVHLSL